MNCNFDLDQEVWWVECDPKCGVCVRHGFITHISWRTATICCRPRKIFKVGTAEVELPFLYHSKQDAIAGVIAKLTKLFDCDA